MPPYPDSSGFSARLYELSRDRHQTKQNLHMPSKPAISELARQAAFLVTLHLAAPARLRPSAIARRLATMSKALGRAADSAEAIGRQGIIYIIAASGTDREPAEVEHEPHLAYLRTLAVWTDRAAKTASELSQQALDNRGGRTPNETLRSLVSQLHDRYTEILSMKPTHTVDQESGVGVNLLRLSAV